MATDGVSVLIVVLSVAAGRVDVCQLADVAGCVASALCNVAGDGEAVDAAME